NIIIELNGHEDAQQVFVKGLPVNFIFLVRKNNKWIGKYDLPNGIYDYSFIVDGKEVLDTKTPVKRIPSSFEVDTFVFTHQLALGYTQEVYRTKIKVAVPNTDDIVYIVGDQDNLGGGSPVLRMKKTSDNEREIELELHYPARFKFVDSFWKKEAVMYDDVGTSDNEYPLVIDDGIGKVSFKIKDWKER
ncbi:MAG: hypothetical protein AAFP96_07020, partial [Bacteroidota bacterium]